MAQWPGISLTGVLLCSRGKSACETMQAGAKRATHTAQQGWQYGLKRERGGVQESLVGPRNTLPMGPGEEWLSWMEATAWAKAQRLFRLRCGMCKQAQLTQGEPGMRR